MEINENFYLTLSSNSSMNEFPNNKTSRFTIEIPNDLNLRGDWEAALVEIHIPITFMPVRRSPITVSLLGFDESGHPHLRSPIVSLLDFDESGRPISRSLRSPREPPTTAQNDETMSSDKSGEKNAGKKEKNIARKVRNTKRRFPESFESSGIKEFLNSEDPMQRERRTNLILERGVYRNIEELIEQLNLLLKEHARLILRKPQYMIELITSKTVDDGQVQVIEFPDTLSEILGFSTNRFMSTTPTVWYADSPSGITRAFPNQLFVYSDVILPHIVSDVHAPLLRIVECKAQTRPFGSIQTVTFTYPHYYPTVGGSIRVIENVITDHTGSAIPFEHGTLTLTLHFRRRQH